MIFKKYDFIENKKNNNNRELYCLYFFVYKTKYEFNKILQLVSYSIHQYVIAKYDSE